MKLNLQKITVVLGVVVLLASTKTTDAFALLGPVQPWMQTTNGVIFPGDIGGPMEIGSGYRWNVPVVTYGFDQSFLDYFGTNGVAAVTAAIQILNNLPTASSLVLTNYPYWSGQINYAAQILSLYDLKSETLQLLVGQLGMAQPTRNLFVIKQWNPILLTTPNSSDWFDGIIPNYIVQRNYDPQSFAASPYINGSIYFASIGRFANQSLFIQPTVADPFANSYTAVADFNLNSGEYFTGLTYDDVGGLRYLLSTNLVNYETLLASVHGVGTNTFVNGAWRPGVDKITFIPQPINALTGAFLPTTNQFTDTYITNGNVIQQQLQRVINQPDFLFTAADTDAIHLGSIFDMTGTTNWINNSFANGNTNGSGPGVIQPPVQITFNKSGSLFETGNGTSDTTAFEIQRPWASFDGSTNDPVIYPIPQSGTNQMTVRMQLQRGKYPYQSRSSYQWQRASTADSQFTFQTSTDLVNWVNLFVVTNNGSVTTFYSDNPTSPSRFYQLIP